MNIVLINDPLADQNCLFVYLRAVLVFLPGYDEIVSLRDSIQEDKRFADSNRYILYTLHSQMQSQDQKKVFRNAPAGVRKIILSTNIAETSITINDVVFVIDSGKVKEVSMLKTHWVSKASALQRKGRAGRCRTGVCYHLFSRIRYDHMQEYQDPEILRHPLQELCLHTKLLAPINCPIADFLAKAPEPPAFLITRNAVHLLKQIDALDPYEDLSELGHHLADLPVDPRYGKMILYSVVLKCLDPILTIACALAYKDPFVLPAQAYQKRAAAGVRRKFAAGTFSDHMALLRAFQSWQKAVTEGWERPFCDKNFLSAATLEMIVGTRTQLLGHLRASGFVRARGGCDIRDLNSNSENWAVVKAALCAGLYPNVIRVDRDSMQFTTMKENKIRIHNSSVLNVPPSENYKTNVTASSNVINVLPTDWLMYEEITRAHRLAQVRCCTLMSPVTMAIFAGPAKLSNDIVQEAEASAMTTSETCSDSEGEEHGDSKVTNFRLDDWIYFQADHEASNLIMQLRQKWHSLFIRRMKAPSKPFSPVDENVIRTIVAVLTSEEQMLGLQQPVGIGKRPKLMSMDSFISSGGSRRGSYDTEHSDDSSSASGTDIRQTPTRSRPFKFQTTTPRKKDLHYYSRSSEDKSETSSIRSGGSGGGSGNGSGANSLRGSAASSPCSSPQLSSPAKPNEEEVSARYFVMKSANYKNLDISWQRGIWAATPSNEKRLTRAYKETKEVFLIFSVHGSGHFQGYAKMTSLVANERCRELTGNNLGNVFNIVWIKKMNLPFQQCHHLINPWNENRRVQISRDGQELEPSTGEALLQLWDTLPQSRVLSPRFSTHTISSPESPHGYNGKTQWNNQQGGYRSQKGHWKGQGQTVEYGFSGQQQAAAAAAAAQTTLTSAMASPQMTTQMAPPFNPMYVSPVVLQQKQSQQGVFPSQQSPSHTMSPVMILQRGAATPSGTTVSTTASTPSSTTSGRSTKKSTQH
ncbi:hypothetical protein LSH36_375g06007 [Paralvinella palmiformis]|uniref:ATP-dependent RNA helicase YTHDC2 n=1 Tax=Paralvinella palmiformis TaxID=53620 RepID=A0AAD9JEB0_9ANNE|nr:hypothetical protein LSH36_375g06007 [Paralvinella palmiformis]